MKTKFGKAIKALERERKLVVAEAISHLLGHFKGKDVENMKTVDVIKMVSRNEKITQSLDEAIAILKQNDKSR